MVANAFVFIAAKSAWRKTKTKIKIVGFIYSQVASNRIFCLQGQNQQRHISQIKAQDLFSGRASFGARRLVHNKLFG